MTRVLSELLNAREPVFRHNIQRLEQAAGRPSADIRLTSEVVQGAQVKLRELGLDPHNTTGPELYAALRERLKADDARLVASLQEAAKSDDVVMAVAHTLRTIPIPKNCFALKNTVAKKLLKKLPPKRAMKQLGYRSFDSMLKHEPVAALYAAAWLLESPTWHKNIIEQYKTLKATDFETREVTILNPASARWQQLAGQIVAQKKHNLVALKELGTIVLLPLAEEQPPAAATATLLLSLHAWNEIRASSTFLKLCQVKSDFGHIVQNVVTDEPHLSAAVLDEPVPWQIIQRYYSRMNDVLHSGIFEPHIQPEDLSWHSIEKVLEHLEPSMAFWRGTTHLSLLHDHQPVSFNVMDVCLSYCNRFPYEKRIVEYFRYSLWHELLLRYLKHENVEQTVLGQLQAELVAEPALM